MQIQVKGLVQVQGKLTGLPKQVQYATMQAINDIAKEVQKHEVEKQLPSKFTLRSKGSPWWKPGTRFGVNIIFARRNNLTAVIGSQADWLKHQEEGGVRSGKGHRLAIESGARPDEKSVLPTSVKPRALLRQKGQVYTTRRGITRTARRSGKGFIINTKSGPAIFTRDNGGLKLMYVLRSGARIPAILQFFQSGKRIVEEKFQAVFSVRLDNAIKTAK